MKAKKAGRAEKIYINEIIRINYKCNWKCKFCNVLKTNNYGDQDVTNKEIRYQILNLTRKYPTKEQRRSVILSFSGGEPTLNPKLPEFIRFAKKLGIGTVEIQTNGSILFVRKKLILDLIDAGLDEVFMAQHSHIEEVNKELGAIYRVKDFEDWVEFVKENDIHNKVSIYLNIVVGQINIAYLTEFAVYLRDQGFLDFIMGTHMSTDTGDRFLRKISVGLTQPNGYAELNADQVVLEFNDEQKGYIDEFVEWCDANDCYPDFHFTSPPVCVLDYPQFNLEHSRLKKLEEDSENGEVNAGNLQSYKFLWKEKRKFSECESCPNTKYCLGFYNNWINYVGEEYAHKKAVDYVAKNS